MSVALYAAFLVAYGNAASLLVGSALPIGQWLGPALGGALAVTAYAWGRVAQGLDAADIFGRGGVYRGAAVGFGLALLAGSIGVLVIRFPPIFGAPIVYAPVTAVSLSDLLVRVFVTMPLDTVLPEEVAFRGILLSLLRRRYATPPALVLAAVPFALWHGWIVLATVAQTNLVAAPPLAALALAGAFAATFAGGVASGLLRLATGHLASSLAAHWTFNATLLLGLRVAYGI